MKKENCFVFCLIIFVLGVLACGSVFLALDEYRKPRYYAAIDSLSGLDPATDLGRPSLDPLFNITLSVASQGFRHSECIPPGTYVEVSYRGSPLATGTAVQLCARPRKAPREQSLVAWGRGVSVPGFRLDNLAADARLGVEAFEVTLQMPPTHDHVGKIVTCKARRVGDDAALRAPCDSSNMGHYWTPSPKDLHGGA
ncbi:hypothetical protein CFC21_022115 [Triticum aestivum]|uniref:Uncharacterized protein n=2 Tax=Triticum aestivum TaxID=4565 RepID=A0A9R1EBU7_WHEAT|nr:hypothetical protein CFC21_022115 [Triticum aestivum]